MSPYTNLSSVEEIIPDLKNYYLKNGPNIKSKPLQANQIEADLQNICRDLKQAFDFMKEILTHPNAFSIMQNGSYVPLPNSRLMDSDDLKKSYLDLQNYFKLMEDSLSVAKKKNVLCGNVLQDPISEFKRIVNSINPDQLLSLKEIREIYDLYDKFLVRLQGVEKLNENLLNSIYEGLDYKTWCKDNQIETTNEKSPVEFKAMAVVSTFNSTILRNFQNDFSSIVNRAIILNNLPSRFTVNHASYAKFVYCLSVLKQMKSVGIQESFRKGFKTFTLLSHQEWASRYALKEWSDRYYNLTDKFIGKMEAQFTPDYIKTIEENAQLEPQSRLEQFLKVDQNNKTFKDVCDNYSKDMESLRKEFLSALKNKIAGLPPEQAEADKVNLNAFLSDIQEMMSPMLAAPLIFSKEISQLVNDVTVSPEPPEFKFDQAFRNQFEKEININFFLSI